MIKLFLSINISPRRINSRIKGIKPEPENLALSRETHPPACACAPLEPTPRHPGTSALLPGETEPRESVGAARTCGPSPGPLAAFPASEPRSCSGPSRRAPPKCSRRGLGVVAKD